MVTDCFFERMRRYFLDAFFALSPCQGRVPLRKYIYHIIHEVEINVIKLEK